MNDYEECGECGFDHDYEPEAAKKAHESQEKAKKDREWDRIVAEYIIGEELEHQPLKTECGRTFALWLDGYPDEFSFDADSDFDCDCEYLTTYQEIHGLPEKSLEYDGRTWKLVSKGFARPERECLYQEEEGDDPPLDEVGCCRYCGAALGEKHGMAYQGEMTEAVYKRVRKVGEITIDFPSEPLSAADAAKVLKKLASLLESESWDSGPYDVRRMLRTENGNPVSVSVTQD